MSEDKATHKVVTTNGVTHTKHDNLDSAEFAAKGANERAETLDIVTRYEAVAI